MEINHFFRSIVYYYKNEYPLMASFYVIMGWMLYPEREHDCVYFYLATVWQLVIYICATNEELLNNYPNYLWLMVMSLMTGRCFFLWSNEPLPYFILTFISILYVHPHVRKLDRHITYLIRHLSNYRTSYSMMGTIIFSLLWEVPVEMVLNFLATEILVWIFICVTNEQVRRKPIISILLISLGLGWLWCMLEGSLYIITLPVIVNFIHYSRLRSIKSKIDCKVESLYHEGFKMTLVKFLFGS